MKYRVLAKTFLFVKGSQDDIIREDAIWLTEGEKKKFTDKQCDKLNTIFADLVGKAQEKLEQQGVDFAATLRYMPKVGSPVDATGGDHVAADDE